MNNLKLWLVFSQFALLYWDINLVASFSGSYILDSNDLFGGFVGCIWQDVCSKDEHCVDDSLFGKCQSLHLSQETKPIHLSFSQLKTLENVLSRYFVSGIDWDDLMLQCMVRSIMRSRENISFKTAGILCGLEEFRKIPFQETINFVPFQQDSAYLVRPASTTTKKLKRQSFEEDDQIFSFGRKYHSWPTRASRIKWAELGSPGHEEYVPRKQRLREEFDKELKRIIMLLREQNYTKSWMARTSRVAEESPNGKFGHLPNGRFAIDWEKRLNAYEPEPLKRRYQLRLPDDLKPLPQRTRSWVWTKFYRRSLNAYEAEQFLKELFYRLNLASPIQTFHLDKTGNVLYFQVPATTGTTAEAVAQALREGKGDFEGFHAEKVGFGRGTPLYSSVEEPAPPKKYTVTLVVCLSIVSFIIILSLAYCIQKCRHKIHDQRSRHATQKTALIQVEKQSKQSNQSKTTVQHVKQFVQRHLQPVKMKSEKATRQVITEPFQPPTEDAFGQPTNNPMNYRYSKDTVLTDVSSISEHKRKSTIEHKDSLTSQASSTYSWSSEPISCGIDVTTGHLILSYMEAYLREDSRLNADWEAVNAYEAEEATPCVDAQRPENLMKNRLTAPLPYEQSRVKLRCSSNEYINASLIYDHTPRNPVYIATPTPLIDTLSDFWQMVWEQSCVVIVCLERATDLVRPDDQLPQGDLTDACIQYWPDEGVRAYGNFEVHLVSEHSSCDRYIVRSLYLKNLQTAETRTVTQFHYLAWNDDNLKNEIKPMLDFRRKVNRSFRGMMSPIVVHCPDGSSRTGTYMLLDLVLSRISKGVKEINIAATLEHLRDQRQSMVQHKVQYEFVFTAVAHEVDAMLKMNSQNG